MKEQNKDTRNILRLRRENKKKKKVIDYLQLMT